MGKKLDAIAHVILAMKEERLRRKLNLLSDQDYRIKIPSARLFFSSFDFYIRQVVVKELNNTPLDLDEKSAYVEDIITYSKEALLQTLLEQGARGELNGK